MDTGINFNSEQGRNAVNTLLMAGMVSSAVVQETVGQILSGLVRRYEGKEKQNANENLERLEIAHIKLGAALETSSRWLITDTSLIRWRNKLKRAAQECDDTLHKCKQRILEGEQMEQEVRNSPIHKQIVHATKSIIFSSFCRNDNELSGSAVRRFEWFASGASEFLRFIELGGTPRCHMPYDSFVKHLFAGKELQHKIVRGKGHPLFLLWLVPFKNAEHGLEVCLVFIKIDNNAPEDNFFFSVMLQLLESTDIVGTVIKCLQLFAHHFKSTAETIKKEFTQLPTQDFSWVPYIDFWKRKHWENLHSFSTQWFRPDPACCKQNDQHKLHHISNLDLVGLPDASLNSVIEVNLQCQVSLFEYNKQQTSDYLQDSPNLKAGLLFTPHGSSEYRLPADKTCAIPAIYGEEPHCRHTEITLEQLKKVMLPEAIDYFNQNTEVTVYKILWKSKHGTAYFQVEKAGMETPSARRTCREARKRMLVRRQDQELGSRTRMVAQFLNLWVTQAPMRLQDLILDWIQKEAKSSTAAPEFLNHVAWIYKENSER